MKALVVLLVAFWPLLVGGAVQGLIWGIVRYLNRRDARRAA